LWKENVSKSGFRRIRINQRLELVDYRKIFVEAGTSILVNADGHHLGWSCKGYAVDKAIEAIVRCNIRHALVNAGGDIRGIGGKDDNVPWRIAIRDPRDKTGSSHP